MKLHLKVPAFFYDSFSAIIDLVVKNWIIDFKVFENSSVLD